MPRILLAKCSGPSSFTRAVKSRGSLLSLLYDLNETPALVSGQRAGLSDYNHVADAGFVVLVVSLHVLVATHDLAVEGVLYTVLNVNDDGLLHLVRYHVTTEGLAVVTLGSVIHTVLLLAHYLESFLVSSTGTTTSCRMPSSRSRSTV